MECQSLKIGRSTEEVGLGYLPFPWFLGAINSCEDSHYSN